MTLALYFAADLSHVLLAVAGDPATLWYRVKGVKDVQIWRLTPATYARLIWQTQQLEKRFQAGDYPADRMTEIAERMRPVTEFAAEHLDRAAFDAEWDKLAAGGGPRGKLPFLAELPPNPFDARDRHGEAGKPLRVWLPERGFVMEED